MQKSILLITHSFPPASSPASLRMMQMAKNLSDLGWVVHVLCPKSTYYPNQDPALASLVPDGVYIHRTRVMDISKHFGPIRTLQSGQYGSLPKTVRIKDRCVVKNWIIMGLKSIRRRLLYPDIYISWAPSFIWAGCCLCLKHRFNAILATGDPWSIVGIGATIAKLTKIPFVADFRELWSGHSQRNDQQLNRWFKRSEQSVFRRSMLVVANSPTERQLLEASCSIPQPPRFIDIENGFDPQEIMALAESYKPLPKEPFTISYAGSFGYRKPDAFFKGLAAWLDSDVDAKHRVVVKIAGPIEQRVLNLVKSLGLERMVQFLGYLSRNKVLEIMWHSHVLLSIVGSPVNQAFDPTVPAKMYEYAACGRPILLLSNTGGATRFLEAIGGYGSIASNEDPKQVGESLRELFHRHLNEGLPYMCSLEIGTYTRRSLTEKLSNHILSVIGNSGTPSSALR